MPDGVCTRMHEINKMRNSKYNANTLLLCLCVILCPSVSCVYFFETFEFKIVIGNRYILNLKYLILTSSLKRRTRKY